MHAKERFNLAACYPRAGEVCNVTTLTFPNTLFNGKSTTPVPSGYGGLAWSPGSTMDLEDNNGAVRTVNTTSNFTLKSVWALVKDDRLDKATIDNPLLGRELVPDISYTIKIVAHKAGGQTIAFNCNVKVVTSYSVATANAGFSTSIGFGPSLGAGFWDDGPQVPGTRCPVPANMDFSNVNALDFIQVNEATIKSTGRGVITDRVTAPAPGSVSDPPPKPRQVAVYALQYQLSPPVMHLEPSSAGDSSISQLFHARSHPLTQVC